MIPFLLTVSNATFYFIFWRDGWFVCFLFIRNTFIKNIGYQNYFRFTSLLFAFLAFSKIPTREKEQHLCKCLVTLLGFPRFVMLSVLLEVCIVTSTIQKYKKHTGLNIISPFGFLFCKLDMGSLVKLQKAQKSIKTPCKKLIFFDSKLKLINGLT